MELQIWYPVYPVQIPFTSLLGINNDHPILVYFSVFYLLADFN